jgi:DNA/RNA endonuclease YhcR with UshA esterase domain
MKLKSAFTATTLALAISAPLAAHHSFSAEYDETKPVNVTGIVKKVEWQNPHIWFYVEVKDATGKVTTWGFSGGPPGMLQRRGITRDVLKVGDAIKVTGFRAKDGSNNASGGNVTFADGRQVFAGAAEDVVPKQ